MSQATSSPAGRPLNEVFERLAQLRRRVVVSLWVRGLVRVLWLLVAIAAADLVLDWLFRFDRAQRVVLLAAVAAAVGYTAFRALIRPLSRAPDDETLALEVERVHPRLRQSLITAVQLGGSKRNAGQGASLALVNRAIGEGIRLSRAVAFEDTLDRPAERRQVALLSIVILLGGTLAALTVAAPPLQTWFARNVLLREVKWPQDTYLVIANARPDGTILLPRGADWTQIVTVREDSRVVPPAVHLDVRDASGTRSRPLEASGSRQFAAKFTRVLEPFEFRARGGDDVTAWVRVRLVEPPALRSIQLQLTLPGYAGGQQQELPPGHGPYLVLPGSELRLTATANKALAEARLVAAGRPFLAEQDSMANLTRSCSVAGQQLHVEIGSSSLVAGTYELQLTDEDGFREREPIVFTLQRRTDQPPQVAARFPVTRAIVTPGARIPFECTVSDDFGLTQLLVRIRCEGPDRGPNDETSLYLSDQLGAALVHVGQPAAVREVTSANSLDLSQFDLRPGESVHIGFEAADNNDITGPGIGQASVLVLRIVTPEELRADLLRRERELRQQFEPLVGAQDALVVESRALAASLDQEAAALDVRSLLAALERRQTELRRGVATIGEHFAAIAAEVECNKLEDLGGKLLAHLRDEIVEPLARAAEQSLPAAQRALEQARPAEPAGEQKAALATAIRSQTQAAAQLRAILQQMAESESFQEAVNLLYAIEKAQAEVEEQTNRAREERIRRLLDGPGRAGQSNDN